MYEEQLEKQKKFLLEIEKVKTSYRLLDKKLKGQIQGGAQDPKHTKLEISQLHAHLDDAVFKQRMGAGHKLIYFTLNQGRDFFCSDKVPLAAFAEWQQCFTLTLESGLEIVRF